MCPLSIQTLLSMPNGQRHTCRHRFITLFEVVNKLSKLVFISTNLFEAIEADWSTSFEQSHATTTAEYAWKR